MQCIDCWRKLYLDLRRDLRVKNIFLSHQPFVNVLVSYVMALGKAPLKSFLEIAVI